MHTHHTHTNKPAVVLVAEPAQENIQADGHKGYALLLALGEQIDSLRDTLTELVEMAEGDAVYADFPYDQRLDQHADALGAWLYTIIQWEGDFSCNMKPMTLEEIAANISEIEDAGRIGAT